MKSVNEADQKETKSSVKEAGEQRASGIKMGWRLSVLPCHLWKTGFSQALAMAEVGEGEDRGPEAGWMPGPAWLASARPPLKPGAANPVGKLFIALCPP